MPIPGGYRLTVCRQGSVNVFKSLTFQHHHQVSDFKAKIYQFWTSVFKVKKRVYLLKFLQNSLCYVGDSCSSQLEMLSPVRDKLVIMRTWPVSSRCKFCRASSDSCRSYSVEFQRTSSQRHCSYRRGRRPPCRPSCSVRARQTRRGGCQTARCRTHQYIGLTTAVPTTTTSRSISTIVHCVHGSSRRLLKMTGVTGNDCAGCRSFRRVFPSQTIESTHYFQSPGYRLTPTLQRTTN